MTIVVALGGNALLRRGQPAEAGAQQANVDLAAEALAEMAREHQLVVTHGNGPQVGLLALQAEAYTEVEPYPLDVLGAESEGMIGYLLEQAIGNRLPGRPVATLLTQVRVDPADPAFAHPSKPIGPMYAESSARELARRRGFRIAPDGVGFRRVVPSPEPLEIIELNTIRLLLEAGVLVICAGGGGVPVVVGPDGGLRGIECVIDKDLAATLLARGVGAEMLVLLTDVPGVLANWRSPEEHPIISATPSEMRSQRFAEGSMAPKVEAACRFAESTGRVAAIGALADAAGIVRGTAGTRIALAEADARLLVRR